MSWFSACLAVAYVLLQFVELNAEDGCPTRELKRVVFNCYLKLNGSHWYLSCEGEVAQYASHSQPFFVFHLNGTSTRHLSGPESTFPQSFLASTSSLYSVLYECDHMWRDFITNDQHVLSKMCYKYYSCSSSAAQFITESFVTSLEIYNTKNIVISHIISQFSSLIEVDIHDNLIIDLSGTPFVNSSFQSSLSLRRSNINHIPDRAFTKLETLQKLDLSHNKLRFIRKGTFSSLTTLSTLDLSSNLLETISEDAFSGMPNLKTLYIFNNSLQKINKNIFLSNNFLSTINLSQNNIKYLDPVVFEHLTNLKNISCRSCKLQKINDNLFLNSTQLMHVDFSYNEIDALPKNIFQNNSLLAHLYLGFNRISKLHSITFTNKSKLLFFNLTHNNVEELHNDVFLGAPNIRLLNLSNNKINILDDEPIAHFIDVENFDFSENNISYVQLGIKSDVRLRKIYLSGNSISAMKVDWPRCIFLEHIDMDHNVLTELSLPPCIQNMKQTITFSFRHNKISRIHMEAMLRDQDRILEKGFEGCLFNGFAKNFVDLSHNPLNCDCKLYNFNRYMRKEIHHKYYIEEFLNKENVTCGAPEFLFNKSVISLPEDSFGCLFEENCPARCTCGFRGKDNRIYMNCTGSNLTMVPFQIPNNVTVLYFNNNALRTMHSLNASVWDNLTELHADYNLLETVDDWEIPVNLRYLSIRGNKIKTLPESLMNYISNQTEFEFYFGNNSRKCKCNQLLLKKFLIKNAAFVKDNANIVCEITGNETMTVLPLSSVPDADLCPMVNELLNPNQKVSIITVCVLFVLLILVILTYYKQRQVILSFLYIHCDRMFHFCFEENEADEEKIFDAFVAYSSNDRELVMDLLEELENKEPHFQLCIHERNWVPGRFISDNIINSVQSSKRTIIVLSNSFISSPWFTLELRAAVFKMSGDKMNRIIVILAEKSTSLEGIDPELRHVISKRTYLVWGERWFWEKLRYAMPRKSCPAAKRSLCHQTSEMALMSDM